MSAAGKIAVQRPTAKQHTMADFLLSICPSQDFLVKHDDKQRYISLDEQMGKSKRNKNFVGVHHKNVSFMVNDWDFTSRADQIGLPYERISNTNVGKRLSFTGLKIETITEKAGALLFFKDLLVASKLAAQERQTRTSDKKKPSRTKDKRNPQALQGLPV